MTVRIIHSKVSGKAAGTDPNRVYGTHWDADHAVTGLENVDNTSDANKPISTATQAALDAIAGTTQVVTSGPTASVDASASLVVVNQTVGAAITLNLPAAASKTCKVKIVDWKGDAGTNTITVMPNGSETFNGALTSIPINGNGASAVFDPYPGAGYAI